MNVLRPNRTLARQLKAEIDQIKIDREKAEQAGDVRLFDELTEALYEAQHAFFLTGVSSEYEL